MFANQIRLSKFIVYTIQYAGLVNKKEHLVCPKCVNIGGLGIYVSISVCI